MRGKQLLFAVVVVTAACSKKSEPKSEPPASGSAATAPTKTAQPAAGKLDCDKILTTSLREKYLAGFTIENNPQPVDISGECKFKHGEDDGSISVTCHDNVKLAMQASIDGIKANIKGAKDLPGVGAAAVYIEGGKVMDKPLNNQLTAFDDDSNCSAELNLPASMDAAAFARDLLATLPPK